MAHLDKAARDNRSNQLNPNSPLYQGKDGSDRSGSRGHMFDAWSDEDSQDNQEWFDEAPQDNYDCYDEDPHDKAARDNRSNQLNPNNPLYQGRQRSCATGGVAGPVFGSAPRLTRRLHLARPLTLQPRVASHVLVLR